MRWEGRRRSRNVEDRRGQRNAGGHGGGRQPAMGGMGGALVPMLLRLVMGRKRGSIWIIVAGIGIAWAMGINPLQVLGMLQGGGQSGYQQGQSYAPQAPRTGNSAPLSDAMPGARAGNDQLSEFISVVLADTEDTWGSIFQQQGQQYQEPVLVLFEGGTRTACGMGKAAMGPFYCPADKKVYIDLSFYRDLRERYRAPGDFAQAYVVAHEVGHHLQTLFGTSAKVHAQRQKVSKAKGNQLSVMQELQADCYAGIWAHHAQKRNLLEAGDIEEAMTAAAAIGDDRLQKQATGRIVPESFTHGTSAQRQRWFRTGLKTGRLQACNTFAAPQL